MILKTFNPPKGPVRGCVLLSHSRVVGRKVWHWSSTTSHFWPSEGPVASNRIAGLCRTGAGTCFPAWRPETVKGTQTARSPPFPPGQTKQSQSLAGVCVVTADIVSRGTRGTMASNPDQPQWICSKLKSVSSSSTSNWSSSSDSLTCIASK